MFSDLLFAMALLLLFAKAFGSVTARLRITSLPGELFAGMLLGPILGWVVPGATLGEVAQLGIVFFLFLVGLHTKAEDIKEHAYVGAGLALAGAVLSFAAGFFVGMVAFGDALAGVFLGVAIGSTSTVLSVRTLLDAGKLTHSVRRVFLTIDIADEIVAILSLALLSTYVATGTVDAWKTFTLLAAVLGFIVIILSAGKRAVGWGLSISERVKDDYLLITVPIAAAFIVAFASEHIGIAAVTGAFLAGMAMSESSFAEKHIIPRANVIGYGFLIPLYFAYTALSFDLASLTGPILAIVLVLGMLGALAKFIGCGLLSQLFGVSGRYSVTVGIGMIPRGEYSIVIAQIMLAAGVITGVLYSIVLGFVLVSVVLTPILLRLLVRERW